MTEKQRRKLARDAAESVCWELTIATHNGLNDRELALAIKNPFKTWVDLMDERNDR